MSGSFKQAPLNGFFKEEPKKRKRGRPRRKRAAAVVAGKAATEQEKAPRAQHVQTLLGPPPPPQAKTGKGHATSSNPKTKANLAAAVCVFLEPDSKEGRAWRREHGEAKKMSVAKSFGIKESTFRTYVHSNPLKRVVVGHKPGRRPHLCEDQDALVDLVRHRDRSKNGVSAGALQQAVATLAGLGPEQAKNVAYRIRQKHADKLKPRPVKAQASTLDRVGAITVNQQR
jgi:hypothetical protein